MPQHELVIANGLVCLPDGDFARASVGVTDGRIATITDATLDGEETIDASGLVVLPGLIDQHFHSWWGHGWETHETATRAAAKGGVTTVIEMPLDIPFIVTTQALAEKRAAVDQKYYVDHAALGGYWERDPSEMARMADAGVVGYKLFTGDVAPDGIWRGSDDREAIDMMRRSAEVGLTLVAHCENAGFVDSETERAQSSGWDGPLAWSAARPWFAELDAVHRLTLLAEVTGCRTVLAHQGAPRCVELAREARERGVDVWVETLPQLLCLAADEMDSNLCKWIPPTRERTSIEGLWSQLANGHIHTIASDHGPFPKLRGGASIWDEKAGAGNVVEVMLPVVATEAVDRRDLSLSKVAELMSTNPAKIYNLYPRKGAIRVGADADFAIIDPKSRTTIDVRSMEFSSEASRWSPFEGREVGFAPTYTVIRGHPVYAEGEIVGQPGYGAFVAPRRSQDTAPQR